jgi:hypothetical protein
MPGQARGTRRCRWCYGTEGFKSQVAAAARDNRDKSVPTEFPRASFVILPPSPSEPHASQRGPSAAASEGLVELRAVSARGPPASCSHCSVVNPATQSPATGACPRGCTLALRDPACEQAPTAVARRSAALRCSHVSARFLRDCCTCVCVWSGPLPAAPIASTTPPWTTS